MSRKAKPYEPVPGTIPYKVIKHLESLPAGTRLTTAQVNDAMGQTQVSNLNTLLVPAVKAGWIERGKKPYSNHVLWSLGDRQPVEALAAEHDDDCDTTDLAGPAPTPNLANASVFTMAQHSASASATTAEAKADAKTQPDFRCALFSDGQLYIRSNGHEHTLPTDHTRELLRYLDALSPGEVQA